MKERIVKLFALIVLLLPQVALAESLQVKAGFNVMGVVTCNGKGVADVVVSDGYELVKSDAEGRYYLKVDVSKEPEVFISIPSGYEAVGRKGTSSAFYHHTKNTSEVQRFDFELTQVDQTNYEILAIADSHVCSAINLKSHTEDRKQYNTLFIPAFREYGRKCLAEGKRVYAVHSGDFTQAAYWAKGYDIQDYCDDTAVVTEFPMFNAIGNHDHDNCRYVNNNQPYDQTNQHLSRLSFRKALGPAYYSINIGTEHFIFIDNLFINRNEVRYTPLLDDVQMAWLKKDVAAIDRTKIKGLVIVAHGGIDHMKNAKEMKAIFDEFPQTYIIGHHHCDRTFISKTSTGKPIREFWTPTLAGVAWLHTACGDGSPRAFIAYNFKDGEPTRREFIPFDEVNKTGLHYRAYDNRHHKLDYTITNFAGKKWMREGDAMLEYKNIYRPAVIINMWGAVSCEYVGKGKVDIEQAGPDGYIFDLHYRDWWGQSLYSNDRNSIFRNEENPYGYGYQRPAARSMHIWRITPNNAKHPVELLLKDALGKETRVTLHAR